MKKTLFFITIVTMLTSCTLTIGGDCKCDGKGCSKTEQYVKPEEPKTEEVVTTPSDDEYEVLEESSN
jgi:hypothetical protein